MELTRLSSTRFKMKIVAMSDEVEHTDVHKLCKKDDKVVDTFPAIITFCIVYSMVCLR